MGNTDEFAFRIVRPSDCLIGVCFPTTRAEFDADRLDESKHFAKTQGRIWEHYDDKYARHLRRTIHELRALGAHVQERFTLSGIRDATHDGRWSVIIPFAHHAQIDLEMPGRSMWRTERVELADRLALHHEIINQIPVRFVGLFDLCVCNTGGLARLIRENRANCLIRYGRFNVELGYWLYYYLVLFSLIAENRLTYLQATQEVAETIKNDRSLRQ